MKKNEIIIGTRGSKLALWQADLVKDAIVERYPNLSVRIEIIKTTGDKILESSFSEMGGKGIFVKEIENALIENVIDMAVHSVKDVPTDIPDGLRIAAVLKRADPRDVLISKNSVKLLDLPKNSTILTGSLRRRAQILSLRQDINFQEIRGNIDTRFRKFYQSQYEGMMLAKAGVERMGYEDKISEIISENVCLPAAGQGAIGLEIRENDDSVSEITDTLNHKNSELSVKAERAFLRGLGGGCQVPIGILAEVVEDKIFIKGILSDVTGQKVIRNEISGSTAEAERLGTLLSEKILNQGGKEIIREF